MTEPKPSKLEESRKLPPNAGKGRVKGTPNKTTALLKDAILQAAERAGGKEGLIGYLLKQAKQKNPAPFMALVGKVLPMQVTGEDGGPVVIADMTTEKRARALASFIAKTKAEK